jgi:hypothetical protein
MEELLFIWQRLKNRLKQFNCLYKEKLSHPIKIDTKKLQLTTPLEVKTSKW